MSDEQPFDPFDIIPDAAGDEAGQATTAAERITAASAGTAVTTYAEPANAPGPLTERHDVNVEYALYQASIGMVVTQRTIDALGRESVTHKELPPDTRAAALYLQARKPDAWQTGRHDVVRVIVDRRGEGGRAAAVIDVIADEQLTPI